MITKYYTTLLLFIFMGVLSSFAQQPIGWASVDGGTTGGAGGQAITVTNRAQFVQAVSSAQPYIIRVKDTIELTLYERIDVMSNKTIIGLGTDATLLYGGLEIQGDNVIVKNLTITGSYDGDWDGKTNSTDAITIYGQHVWIDHCDLSASADGLLDITSNGSSVADYVTISYTKFHNHNKVMLIGSSDNNTRDRGHLRTTIHHCWFDGWDNRGIHQRMPRIRYGDIHILNNYYDKIASYCIGARFESDVVVENTYFRQSNDPHFIDDLGKGEKDPTVVARGNIYELANGLKDTASGTFEPSDIYTYEADNPLNIPAIVMNEAGIINDPGNDSPIAINDTVYFERASGSAIIDAISNDYDTDGGELRIAIVLNQPKGVHRIRDNKIFYLASGVEGNRDTLVYQLVDTQGGIDTAMVLVVFGDLTNLEPLAEDFIQVYPNPVIDQAQIEWQGLPNEIDRIELFGLTGQKYEGLISKKTPNNYLLNTEGLSSGIYLLRISTQTKFLTKKLSIKGQNN